MTAPRKARRSVGLPLWAVVGLALLAVPRAVLHDLDLAGPVVNAVLVFLPLAVWAAVVLLSRVPNPLVTLLAVGLAYGVLLAVTHQLLWTESFAGDPPALGGNLAGVLPTGTETVLLRIVAAISSLGTGAAVGVATGAVCWLLARLVPGFRPR